MSRHKLKADAAIKEFEENYQAGQDLDTGLVILRHALHQVLHEIKVSQQVAAGTVPAFNEGFDRSIRKY